MRTEIRVFPRRNEYTPDDELAFVGLPPKKLPTRNADVSISVTMTWDIELGITLAYEWGKHYDNVHIGGPAFMRPSGPFVPGRFIKEQYYLSSRGCIRECPWCYIWPREGKIKELQPSFPQSYCLEDCNLLACSPEHIDRVFSGITESAKAHNTLPQMSAFDARLFNEHHLRLCEDAQLECVTFACDYSGAEKYLRQIHPMLVNKPKEWRLCCVLVGYREFYEEALERIQKVIDCGFEPAVMLYQDKSEKFRHYTAEWLSLQARYPRHPGDSVERQEPDGSIVQLNRIR